MPPKKKGKKPEATASTVQAARSTRSARISSAEDTPVDLSSPPPPVVQKAEAVSFKDALFVSENQETYVQDDPLEDEYNPQSPLISPQKRTTTDQSFERARGSEAVDTGDINDVEDQGHHSDSSSQTEVVGDGEKEGDDKAFSSDFSDDENDPVVRSYDIFINAQSSVSDQLHLFQYPVRNRSMEYNNSSGSGPLEARIKARAGLVEVDIPLPTAKNYDNRKGVLWGEAIRQDRFKMGGNNYGLAGGFQGGPGVAAAASGRRGDTSSREMTEDRVDIDEGGFARPKGQVLDKQTLGGKIYPKEPGGPRYMIGAFTKSMFSGARSDSNCIFPC
jgi:RPC5 protein